MQLVSKIAVTEGNAAMATAAQEGRGMHVVLNVYSGSVQWMASSVLRSGK